MSIRGPHAILIFSGVAAASAVVLSAMAIQAQGPGTDIPHPREGISLLQVKIVASTITEPLSPHMSMPVDTRRMGPLGLLHIPYDHIAVNLTYHNFREQVLTFPERRPREFNVMLATIKTFTADLVVQFLESAGRSSWRFDYTRSAAFAIFGFLYIGLAQWILYVSLLTWLFPDAMAFANSPLSAKLLDREGQFDMLGQVLVDNFIFNIFIYFPAFYIVKALVQGISTGESIPARIWNGLTKYRTNMITDNMSSVAVWVPADLFIFAVPMYLRMPLEHGVSFGWTMFISAMRGAPEKTEKTETKPMA